MAKVLAIKKPKEGASDLAWSLYYGKLARKMFGLTQPEWSKILDDIRGKTALYNEMAGTSYNAAHVAYNSMRYKGDALSDRQREILDLPSVAHGHKPGESRKRSTATSKKTVERTMDAATRGFLDNLESAYLKSIQNKNELKTTEGIIPFWKIYESVRDGTEVDGHVYTVEEAYKIAQEYRKATRGKGKGENDIEASIPDFSY